MDDYIDREASPREARWVRAHLAICHACAEHFAFETRFILALRHKLDESARLLALHDSPNDALHPSDLATRISIAIRQPPGQAAGHSSEPGA